MTPVRFAKMSGAGNDFILLDARNGHATVPEPDRIRRWCTRRYAVGADGLILLVSAEDGRLGMRYFNADGSEAAMCGNGGRCLARFAVLLGAAPEGEVLHLDAGGRSYRARVEGGRVRMSWPEPTGLRRDVALDLPGGARRTDVIDTGVPHAVFFTDDVEGEDVVGLGRAVRHHPAFAPEGVNVNFLQIDDPRHARIRTYERGVEDETLACGTGTVAAAILARRRGAVATSLAVTTRSGEVLEVVCEDSAEGTVRIEQRGSARLVYWGEMSAEAEQFVPPGDRAEATRERR